MRNKNRYERKRAYQVKGSYRKFVRSGREAKQELHRKVRAKEREQLLRVSFEDDADFFIPVEQHRDTWEYEMVFDQAYIYYDKHPFYRKRPIGMPDLTDEDMKFLPEKIVHEWKKQRKEAMSSRRRLYIQPNYIYVDLEKLYNVLYSIYYTKKMEFVIRENEEKRRKHYKNMDPYTWWVYIDKGNNYRFVSDWPDITFLKDFIVRYKNAPVIVFLAKTVSELGYDVWTKDKTKRWPEEFINDTR